MERECFRQRAQLISLSRTLEKFSPSESELYNSKVLFPIVKRMFCAVSRPMVVVWRAVVEARWFGRSWVLATWYLCSSDSDSHYVINYYNRIFSKKMKEKKISIYLECVLNACLPGLYSCGVQYDDITINMAVVDIHFYQEDLWFWIILHVGQVCKSTVIVS